MAGNALRQVISISASPIPPGQSRMSRLVRHAIRHAEVMLLFLLAALALPFLPGQPKDLNRERDSDGFGNIKWGMTVAEAKAAFPGLREPERSELTSGAFEERLIQPVLMIGSVEMTVSIQTKADSDLITRVVLKLAPFVQHRKTAFQFLSNNLIQKYGKPSRRDTATRSRMKEETAVWVLPSTTITLDWREESAGKLRLLDITYEATRKIAVPSPLPEWSNYSCGAPVILE
jgi:hypothetical protein